MLANIRHNNQTFKTDLSKPIDISIPLREGTENVNAFNTEPFRTEPVRMGDFVGDTNEGGSVNFKNFFLNPHGNGTHTECVGHISKEWLTINQCLREFFFISELITIEPAKAGGDSIITKKQVEKALAGKTPEAIVIRTLPNPEDKINRQYSNTNPPYIHCQAADFIQSIGIKHLLIDLPSVDKEKDEGKILSHKAFWQYPHNTRTSCTITELIYVPNGVPDGSYLLNILIASFENDASPSKPVLYNLNMG